jgi:hypothetical protein
MKQLNQIISGYEDYPNGPRSVRAQCRCRVAGYLRLNLNQRYQEPEIPTLDLRNEMDFEREAREQYEAEQNTSPYEPVDYLAKAKQYAVVLSECMAAKIYDTNTIQDSINHMCKPVEPSDEVKAFLTAPELEVQKREHEEQVANWRKHEKEICQIIDGWITSDELVGVEYPDDLPEILQKAVKSMFKGLRDARAKTLTGKLKGDRSLTKESYDAGLLDLTALQNSF